MGSQQIVILFLASIITTTALVVGLNLFESANKQANRDNIRTELSQLISYAQAYYKKPTLLGGGGATFRKFEIPESFKKNESGQITHIRKNHSNDHIHFLATGNEKGLNGVKPISIEVRVEIGKVQYIEHN